MKNRKSSEEVLVEVIRLAKDKNRFDEP